MRKFLFLTGLSLICLSLFLGVEKSVNRSGTPELTAVAEPAAIPAQADSLAAPRISLAPRTQSTGARFIKAPTAP